VVFLESHARLLLIVHAVVGAATVATTTHLAVWMARSLRSVPRVAGVRWLATAALALYAVQFGLGNLLYPSFKVHVRAELLDLGSAQVAEARARAAAHVEVLARAGVAAGDARDVELPELARVARAFDIKEHVAALALPLVIAACALGWVWRPDRDARLTGRLLLGFAVAAALASWLAALVGLVATSYRAVG
jgi:hypothetical protein